MSRKVIFQTTAIRSLEQIYAYIALDTPSNARAYLQKLRKKCASLAKHPERCPLAPETGESGLEIRHLIHDRYRIIFTVTDDTVHILDIRHCARLPMSSVD